MICEVCGHPDIQPVLSLGEQPLPDDLVKIGDNRECEKFPINVLFCDNCNTAHQECRVAPEKLFAPDYHYRAAQTKDVVDGMQQFAEAVNSRMPVFGKKVLDIGCNDGTLLNFFRERGALTTGIEPTNAAREAAAKGHGIDQAFFGPREAGYYVRTYGSPDIITFTNVFAHIENLPGLLANIMYIKNPGTKIVIENHYLGSVLATHQFDTFYLEHPRTYSFTSFTHIAKSLDMHIEDVEFPERYGGNIRVFLAPGWHNTAPTMVEIAECDFGKRLKAFGDKIPTWAKLKRDELFEAYLNFGSLSAVAFPARASILMNLLGFKSPEHHFIDAVYEKEGSKKIGHYVPGTRIPIVSEREYPAAKRGFPLLNLAWHIPAEMKNRWRHNGHFGQIIQAVTESDFQ